MCTLIGKKFPRIGWIGVKNRDRPSPTRTQLLRDFQQGLEKVTLVDETTLWSEGMNSHGICVISSSLDVGGDSNRPHVSRDGQILSRALGEQTLDQVVTRLITEQIHGCVLAFDRDRMIVVEGSPNHPVAQREVSEDWVVRTNHGVLIPSAGYQRYVDPIQTLRRISSQARLDIGKIVAESARSPADLILGLARPWTTNPQINTLRTPQAPSQVRTTEQLMMVPSKRQMFVRNVDGKFDFDQSNANTWRSQVLVGII